MRILQKLFVPALALIGTGAFGQATLTSAQQCQAIPLGSYSEPTFGPPTSSWRMANGGSGAYYYYLALSFASQYGPSEWQAGCAYWVNSPPVNGVNSLLGVSTSTEPADAYCGLWSGTFAGRFYDSVAMTGVPATFNGTSTPTTVRDGTSGSSMYYPGAFLDANHDSTSDVFAGYYFDGSNMQGCFWSSGMSPNSPFVLNPSPYMGSEVTCLNSSDDLGGQLFGSSINPPAFWHNTGGTTWTQVDISGYMAWPTGRNGYVVGIDDRDSSSNVYVIGYEEPSSGDGDGQPFIFSYATGAIRFLGTQYGPPVQNSNLGYSTSNPIVSFAGNGNGMQPPYLWLGSPSTTTTSPPNGVAYDTWAVFDPTVLAFSSSFSPTITGLNSAFQFGGEVAVGTPGDPFLSAPSLWNFVNDPSGTQVTYTDIYGGMVFPPSFTPVRSVNGTYITVANAPSQGVVLEADWTIADTTLTTPANIAFRATSEIESNLVCPLQIKFYNNSSGNWDPQFGTAPKCPTFWQTQVAKFSVSAHPEYVSSAGVVKARLSIQLNALVIPPPNWIADVAQMTFLYELPQ